MPTFEEKASTVASGIGPQLCSSWIIEVPTWM